MESIKVCTPAARALNTADRPGTWISLDLGEALAIRNNVYDRLRPIFEFTPGDESPPPAPRHTSKPKAPKAKPAVPKWNSKATKASALALAQAATFAQAHIPPPPEEYDAPDTQMGEDDSQDNVTVASASYMGDEDYDMSQFSTRKRKREEEVTEQQHSMYGDELLDYFLLSRNEQPVIRPDPPTNFQPDWPIDTERHTALHWASSMGDVEVIKQLKRFGANLASQNVRGETPLMRAVNFTNCYEKQTFPMVLKELFSTIDARDSSGCTVIHHAAVMKSGRVTSHSCSRYYLDLILNLLQESRHQDVVQQLLDVQDNEGNTAMHLAAQRDARKCIRALLGRGASTDVPNNEGVRAEDMIKTLNASKKAARAGPQRSSSPFAPDSLRHPTFRDAHPDAGGKPAASFHSEAANMVQSRMTSLIVDKCQDLAASYDEGLEEKDEAQKEAQRILLNTQAELANLNMAIADAKSRLEADEAADKAAAESEELRKKVLAYVTHHNRIAIEAAADRELAAPTGDDATPEADAEERIRLAAEAADLLRQQRVAEADYVEARSVLGVSDRIDKYRHLLQSCLPPEDQELLDDNLDDLVRMMEDEREVLERGADVMESTAL